MRRPDGKESDPTDPIAPVTSADPVGFAEVFAELPLLHMTPRSWAEIAAARLPEFLADHAVCEQQVAMYALSLAGYYPDDATHVSVGALFGIGVTTRQADFRVVCGILLSWLLTLTVAAVLSGSAYWLLARLDPPVT